MAYPRAVSKSEYSSEYDGEEERLIEPFKIQNLKSDSPVMSICPSKGKVTAHGIVSTPCDTNIGDRHLKAVLVLPDLKERASMSAMEGLYELSQKLAVTSPRLLARKGVEDQTEDCDTGNTSLDQAQQREESTCQEKDQQPEEIAGQDMVQRQEGEGHNSTLKQRQEVAPGKVFVSLPIYASWHKIIHRRKLNKKSHRTYSKAYVKAYVHRKLQEYLFNQTYTGEGPYYKKVIKFMKKTVLLLLLGLVCFIFIIFYGIEE